MDPLDACGCQTLATAVSSHVSGALYTTLVIRTTINIFTVLMITVVAIIITTITIKKITIITPEDQNSAPETSTDDFCRTIF